MPFPGKIFQQTVQRCFQAVACLAEGKVGGAAGGDAVSHGGQSALAGQVGLRHAGMCVHVHPCHAVRQLCGMVKNDDVVIQRQVQIQQAIVILGSAFKR